MSPDTRLGIARICVLASVGGVIVWILVVSLNRETYFHYRFQDRTRWEYPLVGVLVIVIATIIEGAISYWVLARKSPGRVWMRALVGLLVVGPWGWLLGIAIMHAPGFYFVHVRWAWALVLVLAGSVVVSGGLHGVEAVRAKFKA